MFLLGKINNDIIEENGGQLCKKKLLFQTISLYRYKLSRTWDSTKPTILFIGLNPSIADETIDDPTITRCINYAKAWGYGTLLMTNLLAFRSTYPKDIYLVDDPIGDENDNYIFRMCCTI